MNEQQHVPVLLNEAQMAMQIKPDGIYIDCTYGRGGHSQAFLSQLSAQGRLFVLDQDPTAICDAKEKLSADKRVKIFHQNFGHLQSLGIEEDICGKVDGIFFDLGVSSPQLDNAKRGFSFNHDGPLDMRMNTSQGQTAAEWLDSITAPELFNTLKEFGEERYAKKIANRILSVHKEKAICTTRQLAEIVKDCYPKNYQGIHPATRTFQAIRIALNNEFEALKKGLASSFELLAIHGRLIVISFHSLEDRIVKRFIRNTKGENKLPKLPIPHQAEIYLKEIQKLVRATEQEININPRSRSAKMRIAEKVMQ
ncbi:MAG: 16S rRNA (cytosine(1402)-N(4))-methyltransferase RsmH [Pseudomonadota bacterium]